MGTAMGPGGMVARGGVAEGSFTATVYGLIRDQNYADAVLILTQELQNFPRSRAALSLLGYCYYYLQDFRSSAQAYEQLVKLCPDVDHYRVYYAQSLYKAGIYEEAMKAASRVDSLEYSQRVLMLKAAISYEEDDLASTKVLVEQSMEPGHPETIICQGCIAFKEGKFEEARELFVEATNVDQYTPELAYNIALCYFCTKAYHESSRYVDEIIAKGVREHPELSVGSNTEGIDVRSVGNTQVLRETALVEAFNLKAAIAYNCENLESAREALSDMPPR